MQRRIKQLFMVIAAFIIIAATTTVETKAASIPKLESSKIEQFFTSSELKKGFDDVVALKNIKKNAKVKVTSSNPKVAKVSYYNAKKSDVSWYDEDGNTVLYGVEVDVRKVGTTTITCAVKQGGSTYTLSCVYIVKKYKNPVSAFMIGSLNCASEFNKKEYSFGDKFDKVIQGFIDQSTDYSNWGEVNETKLKQLMSEKVKIKIKPKKGYKINGIWLKADNLFGDRGATKDKKIKNGSRYSYETILNYDSIYVELVDKKGASIGIEMYMPENPVDAEDDEY